MAASIRGSGASLLRSWRPLTSALTSARPFRPLSCSRSFAFASFPRTAKLGSPQPGWTQPTRLSFPFHPGVPQRSFAIRIRKKTEQPRRKRRDTLYEGMLVNEEIKSDTVRIKGQGGPLRTMSWNEAMSEAEVSHCFQDFLSSIALAASSRADQDQTPCREGSMISSPIS